MTHKLIIVLDATGSMGPQASLMQNLAVTMMALPGDEKFRVVFVIHHGWGENIEVLTLKDIVGKLDSFRPCGGSGIEPSAVACAIAGSKIWTPGDQIVVIGDRLTHVASMSSKGAYGARYAHFEAVCVNMVRNLPYDGWNGPNWNLCREEFNMRKGNSGEMLGSPWYRLFLDNKAVRGFFTVPHLLNPEETPIQGFEGVERYPFSDLIPRLMDIVKDLFDMDLSEFTSDPKAHRDSLFAFSETIIRYAPRAFMEIPLAGKLWRALLRLRKTDDGVQKLVDEMSLLAQRDATLKEWLRDTLFDPEEVLRVMKKGLEGLSTPVRCWRLKERLSYDKTLIPLMNPSPETSPADVVEAIYGNEVLREHLLPDEIIKSAAESGVVWVPDILDPHTTMQLFFAAGGIPFVFPDDSVAAPMMWLALILSVFPKDTLLSRKAREFLRRHSNAWNTSRNRELLLIVKWNNFAGIRGEGYFPPRMWKDIQRLYWLVRYLTVLQEYVTVVLPSTLPVAQESRGKHPATGEEITTYVGPRASGEHMLPCGTCGQHRHMSNVVYVRDGEVATTCGLCLAAKDGCPIADAQKNEPSPYVNEKTCKDCGCVYGAETDECQTRQCKCYACRNDLPTSHLTCSSCSVAYVCPTALGTETWTCAACQDPVPPKAREVRVQRKKLYRENPDMRLGLGINLPSLGRADKVFTAYEAAGLPQEPKTVKLLYHDPELGMRVTVINSPDILRDLNERARTGCLTNSCDVCYTEMYSSQLTSMCGSCPGRVCGKCAHACVSSLAPGHIALPSACQCPFCRAPNIPDIYKPLRGNRPRSVPDTFDKDYWHAMCRKCRRIGQWLAKDCVRDDAPPEVTDHVCDTCKEIEMGAPVTCPGCEERFAWTEACGHLECPKCSCHFCGMCSLIGKGKVYNNAEDVYAHMDETYQKESDDDPHMGGPFPDPKVLKKWRESLESLPK